MLINVLQYIADRDGTYVRERALREVNNVWRDLSLNYELPGCYDTLFTKPIADTGCRPPRFILPWFVHNVRAAKVAGTGMPVALNAAMNRFNAVDWAGCEPIWEYIGENAIGVEQYNAAPLTLELSEKAESEFTVNIVGQTPTHSRRREVVTFRRGDVRADAKNTFEHIQSISKVAVTNCDVVGLLDNAEIFFLPNFAQQTRYTVWQQNAYPIGTACGEVYEVLYRRAYVPLINDEDLVPDHLITAIGALALAQILASQGGKEEQAAAFAGIGQTALTAAVSVFKSAAPEELQFLPRHGNDLLAT